MRPSYNLTFSSADGQKRQVYAVASESSSSLLYVMSPSLFELGRHTTDIHFGSDLTLPRLDPKRKTGVY